MVVDMKVDEVPDEVTNMVVDMEVDKVSDMVLESDQYGSGKGGRHEGGQGGRQIASEGVLVICAGYTA